MNMIKSFFVWLRRCISPMYIMMLFAAFVLWYSTKLGDTYTTEHDITIVVAGEEHTVECTIRGKGTDLISYTLLSRESRFEIPVAELTFDDAVVDDLSSVRRHISSLSLQQAIAKRLSENDVEVVSVGAAPSIAMPSVVKDYCVVQPGTGGLSL